MILAALSLLLAQPQPSSNERPLALVRAVTRAVDSRRASDEARRWSASHSARPRDPAPLVALATIARLDQRFEEAESLYIAVQRPETGAPAAWRLAARLGQGEWRALGANTTAAESIFVAVRDEARRLGLSDYADEAAFNLGRVRGRLRGPRAGLDALEEWWRSISRPSRVDTIQYRCHTGSLLELGGLGDGLPRLESGAALAERAREWRLAGYCRLLQGKPLEMHGRKAEAADVTRRARDHYLRIGNRYGVASTNQVLGYFLVEIGAFAEAREVLESARVDGAATRSSFVVGFANNALANLYLTTGDVLMVRRHVEEAMRHLRAIPDEWGIANAEYYIAGAEVMSGNLTEARRRYAASARRNATAGRPLVAIPAMREQAWTELRLGMLDTAEATIDAIESLDRPQGSWRPGIDILRARLSLLRGRPSEARTLLRRAGETFDWRGGATNVRAMTVALLEADAALRLKSVAPAESAVTAVAAALDQWRERATSQDVRAAMAQLRAGMGALSDLYPAVVDGLVTNGRLDLAVAFVERVRARELVERRLRDGALLAAPARDGPRDARIGDAAIFPLREQRGALRRDEALVTYVLGLDASPTTAFVVTRDTAFSRRLPGRDALVGDIARLHRLATGGTAPAAPARRLGDALLAPIAASLPSHVTRLLVSPDGDLHRIPFDLLALGEGSLAIDRFAITHVPSATALLSMRRSPGITSGRIVAFGDPILPRMAPAASPPRLRGYADPERPALVRLAGAAEEARRVARFGADGEARLRAAASERALRDGAATAGILHFATHALVDAESQSETALVLSPSAGDDGLVTPGELSRLPLRQALVVLSACASSGGVVLGGEGLRGIVTPFLEAGARAVIATQWAIEDRATIPIVTRFYDALARGMRIDDALRQAKRESRADGASVREWGAFVIVGDGEMRPPLRPSSAALPRRAPNAGRQ